MIFLPFEGFMIPGLSFHDHCIWVLNWKNTPTSLKNMTEIWVLKYNGEKICYLNPIESKPIFEKYHSFDKVIPADIKIDETKNRIEVRVSENGTEILSLTLAYKRSAKYIFINLLLKLGNKEKIGERGKTETGMAYHNVPKKLAAIEVIKATYKGMELLLNNNPKMDFSLGDGKPSADPIINYCTHLLEKKCY